MSPIAAISRIFQGTSVNRRIFRAAAAVTAAGILVKAVATFKEFVVAGAFGRSDVMDAFITAFLIPNVLINLISESMNQALVPTLVRVREKEGQESAQKLLSSSMLWSILFLGIASCAMAVFARAYFPLLASNFSIPKLNLSVHLFYALIPIVMVTGIATNCTAVLNTFDRFALPALAPVVTPIAIVLGSLLMSNTLGIWALVYATLAGALVHCGLVVWMMETHGYRFRLRWYGMTAPMRAVAQQYGPVLLTGLVASGGLLVDQAMAASLSPGSVSALAYANRFVTVFLLVFAGAVSTAVTPYISQMVAQENWAGCRHTIRTWFRLTALASAPAALFLIAGSHLLIRFTFQHGAFGAADTAAVAPVLAMYAIQIPFFVCCRVFYPFLIAMRRTDLILYCGLINLVLDVVLNLILMRWYGVAGIALATSLWTASTLFFLWYWTWRLLPRESAVAR
jgi:putative peptidoglycan lipid II flippase